jgi:hypothetical protein
VDATSKHSMVHRQLRLRRISKTVGLASLNILNHIETTSGCYQSVATCQA